MAFARVNEEDIRFFASVVGEAHVVCDGEALRHYGHDETEDLVFLPEVVVRPSSADEISRLLVWCNRRQIPVTPAGARTGLSGGALSVHGGLLLSTERMNRILHIDTDNLQVITQPGVITQVLQEAVEAVGLYYPPDPSSRGSCFIGGNLAENAGGPRAVKYGVTKDFVLDLEVVLADGSVIRTGARTLKNATGYNLTQLMVGSEGTLGIITEAALKLVPAPAVKLLMLIPFNSAVNACRAVSAIFRAGITPSALEFMERDAIDYTLRYVDDVVLPITPELQAHLLVEVDGREEDTLWQQCERISETVAALGAGEVLIAEDEAQKNQLWKLRRKVAEAVKANAVYKEEDTVVPRYQLPELLSGVKQIGARYGFASVCYGHAGDGNLHVNILRGILPDTLCQEELPKAIAEIFTLTVSLGGTISGEHGIGLVQKEYLPIAVGQREIGLMRSIKKIFDPNGILNPGKLFPSLLLS